MVKWAIALGLIWLAWHYLKPAPKPRGELAEARALLGVRRDADAATIRAAHRRLALDAHPDRGGTTDETRRLNAARDLLLARLEG